MEYNRTNRSHTHQHLVQPRRSHKCYYLNVAFYGILAITTACKKPVGTSIPPTNRYVAHAPCNTSQAIRQLFKTQGIEYITALRFDQDCKYLANLGPEAYDDYEKNRQKYDELTKQYGARIDEGYVAKVYIRYISDNIGSGVYANQQLSKGDYVGEYMGKVVKKAKASTYCWSYPPSGARLRGERYSLNGGKCGNEWRFVNHSDNPNLKHEFVFRNNAWHLIYVAEKNISEGEQLLISYGSSYWNNRSKVVLSH